MLLTTNTVLLQGLADPGNDQVWGEFDLRYRPVLAGFARKLGLSAEDAEDAAQDALVRFAREYRAGRYQRERGRLRSWLFAMARACVADLRRKRTPERGGRGDSVLQELPAAAELDRVFESEWRAAILRAGMRELRQSLGADPDSARVLERIALEGRSPAEVATEFGMTVNAVYIAKHRALERLRAILARLERDW
ncbi:MAG: sigma-70 family RNA polymerase sigma factor [Planctomycetota bacterium]